MRSYLNGHSCYTGMMYRDYEKTIRLCVKEKNEYVQRIFAKKRFLGQKRE
ncbi:MAG: hypothetical protein BAJALOKI3v1_710008 [Promethearchaeota archaeon]|nr:MAG: hypothetical protein BAJALOKI3v1_710008 [Candidatus Lokiarchaeota archaeon]